MDKNCMSLDSRKTGKYWFGNKVVDVWNKLPDNKIDVGSLDPFEHRLCILYI